MPKFKVEVMYDKDCGVATTREMELPLDERTFTTVRLDLETAVFVELGEDDFVHVGIITALEDIPDKNIVNGDIVYRDWDDLDPSNYPVYRQLVDSYKPLWGGGPGSEYVGKFLEIYKKS